MNKLWLVTTSHSLTNGQKKIGESPRRDSYADSRVRIIAISTNLLYSFSGSSALVHNGLYEATINISHCMPELARLQFFLLSNLNLMFIYQCSVTEKWTCLSHNLSIASFLFQQPGRFETGSHWSRPAEAHLQYLRQAFRGKIRFLST